MRPTAFSRGMKIAEINSWVTAQTGKLQRAIKDKPSLFVCFPKTIKPINQFPFNNCRKNLNALTFIPLDT